MAARKTALLRQPSLPLPLLDERLCTGCGLCVAICPTDCLAMTGPLPWLPRPGDCISCAACIVVCPAKALCFDEAVNS